jgi:hypothetical protein
MARTEGTMDTMCEFEECAYCGTEIVGADMGRVPELDDDEAWERIAAEHAPDCEWIATRAHRRDYRDEARAAHLEAAS